MIRLRERKECDHMIALYVGPGVGRVRLVTGGENGNPSSPAILREVSSVAVRRPKSQLGQQRECGGEEAYHDG